METNRPVVSDTSQNQERTAVRRQRIIDLVLSEPPAGWSQAELARFLMDANTILESLVLEFDMATIEEIVAKQGFTGDFRGAIEPLKHKAQILKASRVKQASSD
jgi:hypothetical protein